MTSSDYEEDGESSGHARVKGFASERVGDELIANASIGATTLYLDDVSQFDEDPLDGLGWADLNGTAITYTGADPDLNTLALSAGLSSAALEGDFVQLLSGDPALGGAPAFEYLADGVEDDQLDGDPMIIEVEHSLVDKLPGGFRTLSGESVRWERDEESGLRLVNIMGRTPSIDSDFITTPIASAVLRVTKTIASGSWYAIKDVTATKLREFTYDAATGRWWPAVEGYYDIKFGATFAQSADGNARQVRIVLYDEAGVADPLRAPSTLARTAGTTAIETSTTELLTRGMSVGFEVYQASTANLGLVGSDGDPAKRPTDYTILKSAR